MMNRLIISIKREYWENRSVALGIPLVLTAVLLLTTLIAFVASTYFGASMDEHGNIDLDSDHTVEATVDGLQQVLVQPANPDNKDQVSSVSSATQEASEQVMNDGTKSSYRLVALYIAIAWVASFIYLLSSLYTDRKDQSILYWKSMPVSETYTVLTKLFFGCFVMVFVAVLIAWCTSIFVSITGIGGDNGLNATDRFSFVELFIWPLISIVIGFLWGAPIFTFIAMVSAMAKRLPFLLLTVPIIVLVVLEGILFRSSGLLGFIGSHLPFGVLVTISDSYSFSELWQAYVVEELGSLLLGIVLAIIFFYVAVWYRDNKFEV